LVELAGIAALMMIGMDIGRILAVYIAASVLQISAYMVFARGLIFGPEQPIPLRPVLAFGGVYFLNSIVDYFLGRHGDILFLRSLLHDSGAASMYDVAFSVTQAAVFASTIGFSGVTFAAFSRLAVTSGEALARFYMLVQRLMTLLTILPAAFLLFHAEALVRLIYPSQYAGASFLVQGMAAWKIGSRLFGGGENAEFLLARGKVASFVAMSVLGALTNVVLNIVLIPQFAAQGSVIASGAGNLVAAFATFQLVRGNGRIALQAGTWLKAAAVCLGASWLALAVSVGSPGISIVLEAIVYAVCCIVFFFILKPLTTRDVEWLTESNPRLKGIAARFAP
jgi:O-antigen/teichoic acid export membrane protein